MNEIWTWLINNTGVMMVILTGITIIISIILQIRIEKQRNEDIRARVHGTLVSDDVHTYLCLSNIGKQCAWNVRISLNCDFIDVLPNHMKNKEYLKILNDEPIIIEPGDKLYYLLDSTNDLKKLCSEKSLEICIKGRYCDKYMIKQ